MAKLLGCAMRNEMTKGKRILSRLTGTCRNLLIIVCVYMYYRWLYFKLAFTSLSLLSIAFARSILSPTHAPLQCVSAFLHVAIHCVFACVSSSYKCFPEKKKKTTHSCHCVGPYIALVLHSFVLNSESFFTHIPPSISTLFCRSRNTLQKFSSRSETKTQKKYGKKCSTVRNIRKFSIVWKVIEIHKNWCDCWQQAVAPYARRRERETRRGEQKKYTARLPISHKWQV